MREIDKQLFQAVSERKVQKINEALQNGADINAVDEGGKTPLMNAINNSFVNMNVVDALCTRKTNLNAQDNDGYTALMYAACNGISAAIQKLLELGADADITNKQGYTAHSLAQKEGFYWVCNYLEAFEQTKTLAATITNAVKSTLKERDEIISQLEIKNKILTQKNKSLQKELRQLRAKNAQAAKLRRYKIAHQFTKATTHRQGKNLFRSR